MSFWTACLSAALVNSSLQLCVLKGACKSLESSPGDFRWEACWFQVSYSGVYVLQKEGKTLKLNKLHISAPYLPLFTCDKWTKCSCKVTCMYVDRSLNWSIVLRALLELAKQLSTKRSIWGPGDDKLTQQSLTRYFFYFSLSCIVILFVMQQSWWDSIF